jgi:uncharacterized protein YegL
VLSVPSCPVPFGAVPTMANRESEVHLFMDSGDDAFSNVQRARPLPVLVLADVSGSMSEHGKIQTLNASIAAMVRDFATVDSANGEIAVGVITFGNGEARVHQPVEPASVVQWSDLVAMGDTPLGRAFQLTRTVLDDETAVPKRAYHPTLVLVSDGRPTDKWEGPLDDLLASPRGSRAVRLAVAVGSEAGSRSYGVLQRFIDNPAIPVVTAEEVDRLKHFFSWVATSVTTRVRSSRPDDLSSFDPDELYDLTD